VSANGSNVSFVIPGSSIKGSLRSQSERIMRTLLNKQTESTGDSRKDFSNQLEQVDLIRHLFGTAAKIVNGEQVGNIGALSTDDCYASLDFSEQQWLAVTSAQNESGLRTSLDAANLNSTQQAFHVAIDRWTGGAAEGFLYSNLEPIDVSWQPIRLTINCTRIKEKSDYLPAIALILLTLRDLSMGKIPLGYGTNRGMGAIGVTNIKLTGSGFDELLPNLSLPKELQNGDITGLDQELLQHLTDAWQTKIVSIQEARS